MDSRQQPQRGHRKGQEAGLDQAFRRRRDHHRNPRPRLGLSQQSGGLKKKGSGRHKEKAARGVLSTCLIQQTIFPNWGVTGYNQVKRLRAVFQLSDLLGSNYRPTHYELYRELRLSASPGPPRVAHCGQAVCEPCIGRKGSGGIKPAWCTNRSTKPISASCPASPRPLRWVPFLSRRPASKVYQAEFCALSRASNSLFGITLSRRQQRFESGRGRQYFEWFMNAWPRAPHKFPTKTRSWTMADQGWHFAGSARFPRPAQRPLSVRRRDLCCSLR